MGKITQKKTSDREEMPQPRRKRRRKEFDRIHSKILKAKRKLDNVEKEDKGEQKKQSRAKICSRLLPQPVAGIYRNGAKGKEIRKTEKSANIFDKARLNADALKLFNGDTPKSECIIEISSDKPSPNKGFVKHSLEWTPGTLEQSPVLSKEHRISQNQNLCLIKKKGENKVSKKLDPNKIKKQSVNDESKCAAQKEDVCKRRLFQNDKEQSKNIIEASTVTPTQISDNVNLTKENAVIKNQIDQKYSKDSKNPWDPWDPLNCYIEFCNIISAENFKSDFLQNYQPDPVATTMQKLRNAYADSYRQQLLREKSKRELADVELACEEHQACTYSDMSQFSPIKFEVPKSNENTIATYLQKGVSQQNTRSHLIQSAELKKSSGITHYNSTSCSSQNTFATYDINNFIMENHKNSDNQYAKQSNAYQLPKSFGFFFVNEKNSTHSDSQKNSKHIGHPSKNNRNNKDNFHVDIPDRRIDNTKHMKTLISSNNSMLPAEKHLSKDYPREKLSAVRPNNCAPNDIFSKCNDITNNMKNVKRIPTILRRYNSVTINKNNHFVQTNDDYTEDLHKKATNLFNKTPDKAIEKEFYATEFPDFPFGNFSDTINRTFDQSKLLEPHIGSMKIKDSQEFDINIRPNKSNAGSYHPINYLQHATNFSNYDIESAKPIQQAKLTIREINNAKKELPGTSIRDQNQNILFNGADDRVIPTVILNFPQNIQTDKKFRDSTHGDVFSQFDSSLDPQIFEASYNTNAYSEKLIQQEQVASNMRTHCHSSNYRPINHLQRAASFSNCDIEPAKPFQQTIQQAKLHMREVNNAKKELPGTSIRDQNQNILLNDKYSADDKDMPTVMPTVILNFPQNIQVDKKSRDSTCEDIFDKNDVKCGKDQINQNMCHCKERYIYVDSAHCPHKYNVSQAHHFHEDTVRAMVQPKILHGMKNYNNDRDNCVNLSNSMRNVPLLPLEQKHNPCMCSKVIDDQHCGMLLQNVSQPIKYLAVRNDSGIQRIPIYVNDGNVMENVSLREVTLIDPNIQSKAFPQEIIPSQTNGLQFDNFVTHKKRNQFVVKPMHLDSKNTRLLNPESQSNVWYTSNL